MIHWCIGWTFFQVLKPEPVKYLTKVAFVLSRDCNNDGESQCCGSQIATILEDGAGDHHAEVQLQDKTTDQAMFNYVVASEMEAACRVIGILWTPTANDNYTTMKNDLLCAYGLSNSERANTVLDMLPLANEKPSELWAKLCCVAPWDTEHPIIRRIFLRKLAL